MNLSYFDKSHLFGYFQIRIFVKQITEVEPKVFLKMYKTPGNVGRGGLIRYYLHIIRDIFII